MSDLVDLTPHQALVDALLNAEREADRWEKMADILKTQIQALMGEATHAECAGQPVFTWKPVGKLNVKKLQDAEPELYRQYLCQFTVTELDRESLAEDHPQVFESCRGRVFNRLVK